MSNKTISSHVIAKTEFKAKFRPPVDHPSGAMALPGGKWLLPFTKILLVGRVPMSSNAGMYF